MALLKRNNTLRRHMSTKAVKAEDAPSLATDIDLSPGTDRRQVEQVRPRQSPDIPATAKPSQAEAGKRQLQSDLRVEKRLNSFDTGDSAVLLSKDSHFFFGGFEKAVPTFPLGYSGSSTNGVVRRGPAEEDGTGATGGKRKILGGLFSKKVTPVSSPPPKSDSREPFAFTPREQTNHRETKIYADPPSFPRKQNGGLFRSRSRLNASPRRADANKQTVKRANTSPISGADISSPLPVVLGDKYKPHPRQNMGSPKLNVDIPKVTMERYSVMFGTLLQRDASPPGTVREESSCEKAKNREDTSELRIQQPVPDKSPVLPAFSFQQQPEPEPPTSELGSFSTLKLQPAQNPLSSNPVSRKREMSSKGSKQHRHKRSLTASDILSSKPKDSSQVVVMVQGPKTPSSERAKSVVILNSPTSPAPSEASPRTLPPPPDSPVWAGLPDSPLPVAGPSLGDAMAQGTHFFVFPLPLISPHHRGGEC